MLIRFLRQDPHLPAISSFACPPSSLPRCRLADYAMAAALVLLMAPDAEAATYRYASSTNRIYVENGGTATLGAIRASTPSLPASALVRSGNTWTLNAYIHIEDGSTLLLHGSAVGGDVDELRLKSDSLAGASSTSPPSTATSTSTRTRIRSWNASASGPDTDYADGRAFIRVRSYLDADGVAPLSRAWTSSTATSATSATTPPSPTAWCGRCIGDHGPTSSCSTRSTCVGDIIGSHIHHNYFGIYTYGHNGGAVARQPGARQRASTASTRTTTPTTC